MGNTKKVKMLNTTAPGLLLLFELIFTNGYPQPDPNTQTQAGITMPAMARKAGGNWRPELLKNEKSESNDIVVKSENKEEYDYDEWFGDDSSEECSDNMFYHVRGRKCVPLRCPEYTKRNKWGDCEDNYPNYWYRSYWAPRNSPYRNGGAIFRTAYTPKRCRAKFCLG